MSSTSPRPHAGQSPPPHAATESRGHRSRCDQDRPRIPDRAVHAIPQGASPQTALYNGRECRDRHRLDRAILAALPLSHASLLEPHGNRLECRRQAKQNRRCQPWADLLIQADLNRQELNRLNGRAVVSVATALLRLEGLRRAERG